MDGILIIDKPGGITSHDVVARVRRILKTKRVGHTGTLDPFATGVVVVLVGRATRLARFLAHDDKEYAATVRFGFETETGDRTGKARAVPSRQSMEFPTLARIAEALAGFRGSIMQVPPMYSAKKIEGRKLYEIARGGETVARPPVPVHIHALELAEPVDLDERAEFVDLRVTCSAGTYIRTLAEDIGRKLGVGAHLAELRRTRAGRFKLSEGLSIEELEQMEDKSTALLSIESAVTHLPRLVLDETRVAATSNGMSTRTQNGQFVDGDIVRMLDPGESLIAIGIFDAALKCVKPKIVLV